MVKEPGYDVESMQRDIFISHVEEDKELAIKIASGLEDKGWTTWYYERDSPQGISYLISTGEAINKCRAILLIVSRNCLESHQVSREVERAHEDAKPIFPVLVDVTYAEFITRQPMWRQAIGTRTSMIVPSEGVDALVEQIRAGLLIADIQPSRDETVEAMASARAAERTIEIQAVLRQLGGRVAVGGDRSFVFGYKPPIRNIYGRIELVQDCVDLVQDRKIEYICLYGAGGIGKSTLASLIFHHFSVDSPGKFERYVWYDLRSEPDPETILLHLLTIQTRGNVPSVSTEKSPYEFWLNMLRMRLADQPMFLVLDNLDSLFDPEAEAGTFIDNRWLELFRMFIDVDSAIIVTSRQLPKFHETATEFVHVDGISSLEAVKMMREAGLRDGEEVFNDAHRLLQGHPMALKALAAAVMHRPSYRASLARAGDIMDTVRRCPDRSLNPVALFESIIDPDRLSENEYALITAMPVLLRPENEGAIASLYPEMDPGEVAYALDELFLRSLIQADLDCDPPLYSMHPLVREVAVTQLENHNRFHERIFNYYVSRSWDRESTDPNNVEHLRLAAQHALVQKNLKLASDILYGEIDLSAMYTRWGRFDLALPVHRYEYSVAKEVGTENEILRAATQFSKCMARVGKSQEAMEYAEEALVLAIKTGDRENECDSKCQIGRLHFLSGDFNEAYQCLVDALEISIDIGNERQEGVIRGYLGQILSKRGEFDSALEYLEKAQQLAGRSVDSTSGIEWQGSIGQIHSLRGNYDTALDILNSAKHDAIGFGDKVNESKFVTLIGQIQMWRGKFDEALKEFDHALSVDREIANMRHEGALLNLIANIHELRGDHVKALEMFEESIHIASDLGSKAAEAFRRGQVGNVYLEMGDYDKAYENLKFACEFAIKVGNKTNECVWCGSLGKVYLYKGDYDLALEYIDNALKMSVDMQDKDNESEWWGMLGERHLLLQEYEQAGTCMQKALALALESQNRNFELTHRRNLGRLYMASNRPREAVSEFERVLELTESMGMVESCIKKARSNLESAKR